jgi:hypothetical protein
MIRFGSPSLTPSNGLLQPVKRPNTAIAKEQITAILFILRLLYICESKK